MNAEDIANSKMIDFDNFDKEEVQGSIVKSERFFNTTLKPEIKSAGQDDQNINNDEEEIDTKDKRSTNKKNSLKKDKDKEKEEIIFDSPFNQMYFHHFEAFLIEFLKKTYPNNFTLNT